jgi:hypothetical protein
MPYRLPRKIRTQFFSRNDFFSRDPISAAVVVDRHRIGRRRLVAELVAADRPPDKRRKRRKATPPYDAGATRYVIPAERLRHVSEGTPALVSRSFSINRRIDSRSPPATLEELT